MRLLAIPAVLVAAFAAPALAADDPIAVRQALMSSNGGAGAVAGAILKGEMDYSPAVGRAVISSINGVAMAIGDFFPEGSLDTDNSRAAPDIWEDMAGFQAEIQEFQAASAAAMEVSGRDGPPDAAAFGAAMTSIFDTCSSCHETYRLED